MDKWNKLCRTCLNSQDTYTYFLFSHVSSEMFTFCTSIEIKSDEDLPVALCNNCYELLTNYTEFKRTCIQSQNILLSNYSCLSAALIPKLEPEINLDQDIKDSESVSDDGKEDISFNLKYEEFGSDELENDVILNEDLGSKIEKNGETKRKKLRLQISKCKEKKLFACEVCPKTFFSYKSFEHHKSEHDGKKVFHPCQHCPKIYVTDSGLQRHCDSKHSAIRLQRLVCQTCGRVCGNKQTLQAHQRLHQPRGYIMCHVCGQSVASEAVLKTHLDTHQSDRERRHTCEHCGKKFFNNNNLLSHIARLHTNRRYICDYCNYSFTEKHNLAKHILIHGGKKEYACDICSKAFMRSTSLTEHKRIHSGERPFQCTLCSKSFITKRILRDHHRIHSGERPHKCDICEHRFTQRGTLQRHIKIHNKTTTVKVVN